MLPRRRFRGVGSGLRDVVENMKKWQCLVCSYVYDEAVGDPGSGIPPGTAWEDVPDDWTCPDCGAAKSDFEMVQI